MAGLRDRRNRPNRTFTGHGATCQQCGQRIVYVKMLATGKRIPVDPMPVADGNVCAMPVGTQLHGFVISAEHPAVPGRARFAAHFGTCPDRVRPSKPSKPRPEPPEVLF